MGEGLKFEVGNVADDNITGCELLGAGRYEVLGTRAARIYGHGVSFFGNKHHQSTYMPCYTA